MSDERDGTGAAGDGGTTEDGDTAATERGSTAVATRPTRPTGKRSRQAAAKRDGDTVDSDATPEGDAETDGGVTQNGSGKKPKTDRKQSGPGRNPIRYVITYLQQVYAELRKVIWPNRKQMVSYTTVVLIFLAFMVAMISGVDLGASRVIGLVFGE